MASTKATTKRKTTPRPPKKAAKRDAKKDLIARRNQYAAKFFPYIEKWRAGSRAACRRTSRSTT
jgi:hypothetical protein